MDYLSPSLPFIKALQLYGWLAGPMKILSFLGSEQFFLLLLPLVYWNINRRLGARLGALLIFSVALNDIIKVAFALPRPFWSSGIGQLASAPEVTFGFPSGHAQSTAVIWTYLALQTRKRVWLVAAFGLLILVALSRLFVGAHYPVDIVGGALIGYALLAVFLRFEAPLFAWWNRHGVAAQIGAIGIACAILGALYWLAISRLAPLPETSPGFETYVKSVAGLSFAGRMGALFGLLFGLALARRFAVFATDATLAMKVARFALGLAVLAGLRFGLSRVLPPGLPWSFGVYFLLTFWVTCGAPALFLRLGWMRAARENALTH